MAFSYCPHCGFKNMYSIQAPKFCGGCGESLNILSAAKQKKSKPAERFRVPRERINEKSYDPDGLDIFEVPEISKLSYSIEVDKISFDLKDVLPSEEELDNMKKSETQKPKKLTKRGRPRKS